MNAPLLPALAAVLAAPFRQRRNVGPMWGGLVVVAMLALAPTLLFGWSLYMQWGAPSAPAGSVPMTEVAAELRHTAANVGVLALAALVLMLWAMVVASLLDQNRPVLAHLLPNHPGRLRAALLAAWVAAVAGITLLVGVRFGAPLLTAALAATGLAVLAASVRWPLLWMLGCVAPFVVNYAMSRAVLPRIIEAMGGAWRAQAWSLSLTAAAAAAVLLVALIQSGGARHVASDRARRQRVERFLMRSRGSQPVAVGRRGHLDAVLTRPYYAWWRVVLARPGRPAFARLMLGLGPGAHWTAGASAIIASALALAAGLLLLQVVGVVYPPAARIAPDMLASFSTGLVIALLSPAMQIHARLHQSRREQALLALLPGLPRGAAFNRRLAWQLTAQFLMAWVGALGLAALCLVAAHALRADAVRPVLVDLCELFAISALPMFAVQWRAWSRVGAPTPLSSLGPLLVAGLSALAIFGAPALGWGTHAGVASLCVAAAAAWCALRWRWMAGEPSALPIARLA